MYRNARKGTDDGVQCDGEKQKSVNPRNRSSSFSCTSVFTIRYKASDSDINEVGVGVTELSIQREIIRDFRLLCQK